MAFDTYIKIAGVDGEATADEAREADRDLLLLVGRLEPDHRRLRRRTGLSAGKVSVSSFNVMKKTEASSATLFAACCNGKHFATAVVDDAEGRRRRRPAAVPDVHVHRRHGRVDPVVGLHRAATTPPPSRSAFAFAKVAIEYQKQDTRSRRHVAPAGNASWDLTKVTK